MGVLVPPAIGDDSSFIAAKSTQQVPEDLVGLAGSMYALYPSKSAA